RRQARVHGGPRRVRRARARGSRASAALLPRVRLVDRDRAARTLSPCPRPALSLADDTCGRVRRPLRPGGSEMRVVLAMLVAGFALSGVNGAQAYHRFWANCNSD